MKVNICGRRYHNVYGNWRSMYLNVIEAFEELDADISVSSVLNFDAPEHLSRKITDSEDAVYVYNHTTRNDILENNFYFGLAATGNIIERQSFLSFCKVFLYHLCLH